MGRRPQPIQRATQHEDGSGHADRIRLSARRNVPRYLAILTTIRPRTAPSTIRRPASMTPARSISLVVVAIGLTGEMLRRHFARDGWTML